ncbi:AzlD domain-containing protein [Staphylococcus durrellii]|uniref:AzlD domain-containing protein n=1 Tax=Staphylococcus durrellii TaxID=2781773 RepID=UPI00189FFA6D|nr:AzlD domain-containing protein [Staphylococcus durrellii]MBF7015874.1 AzlD domain-containing protein [Staphylococcus durrellii]
MSTSIHMLLIIVLCGVVTWLTRVIPFMLITRVHLSDKVVQWLSFIPITLFTALIIDGVIEQHSGKFGYTINVPFLVTIIPTVIVAFISRSLTITIVAGIFIMAIIRLLF